MKRFVIALCLTLSPAAAQEAPPDTSEGFSLMEEGAKLMLRGLMSQMEPALDEMGQALKEMEPAIRDLGPKFHELFTMIDDFKNYDAPEMLPNGDIIIRRNAPLPPKPDAPPEFAPESTPELIPGPNGEIEL
jgi:hypothetical protein